MTLTSSLRIVLATLRRRSYRTAPVSPLHLSTASVRLSLFTFQVTHRIDEHTDVERDFAVQTVRETSPDSRVRVIRPGSPRGPTLALDRSASSWGPTPC